MDRYSALVVENSTVFQNLLQQMLETKGFKVLCVKTAQDALDLIECNAFDLICMGMAFSDMSGTQLCEHIRALPGEAQSVPIAMVTAEEEKGMLEAAMRAGATQIFNKKHLQPFDQFLDHQSFSRQLSKQHRGHILYVEDSKSQSMQVIALLQEQGHKVRHVSKAEDALQRLRREEFDLVLTDIFLAGNMSGLDLVKAVREQDHYDNLPLLTLSAVDDHARCIELLRSGATDFIPKPIHGDELLLRVQNGIKTKKLVDTLQQQQAHLQNLAMKDQLTGLYNRHFLMEVGPKKISEAYRHAVPLSLLVIDVDKFKAINDNHGHSTGDAILSGLADVFQSNCRNEDVVARFGGEEFVLILTHCALEDATRKAEALRQKIERLCPSRLTVTVSIGVSALLSEPRDSLSSLFERADQATYQAKEQGRNRVVAQVLKAGASADKTPAP